MRIQLLPRSPASNKDFYKICVVLFIIIYVFLWLSKPECDKTLSWTTCYEPKHMVIINNSAELVLMGKELLPELMRTVYLEKTRGEFLKHWCRERRARLDWKAMLSPCENKIAWNSSKNKVNATDPNTSFISLWDIRPVGQYSRFSIQSQTKEGQPKKQGGDSWRALIRGPSSISPTVIDHDNGTYEVLFLAMEAGVYTVNITLYFTLCEGFKDPPVDWFIIGNAQGKYQRHLEVEGNRDYLQEPLWSGNPVQITVPPAKDGSISLSSISNLYLRGVNSVDCGVTCNFMWDGYGRWVHNTWKSHVEDIFAEPLLNQQPHTKELGTLWVYGDSVSVFFAHSLRQQKLCRKIFMECKYSYNWVYPVQNVTIAKREKDNLDYDNDRVLQSFRQVVQRPEMDEKSAIILNFGLHFVESINFTKYKELINGLVKVLQGNDNGLRSNVTQPKYRGTVIWKTTTAINKERAGNIHLGHKRFLTQQRILLYNAFATSRMCKAGFNVLDVFPITDSYPLGTGTHGAHGPVKNDIVHYSNLAFRPVEDLLEEYFGGK